jgi:hypothetical protein
MWQRLTHNQQRFAIAMLDSPSKKDAALAIQVEPDTVYRWNGEIDDVIAYMRTQAKDAAIAILVDKVTKAAMVKIAGLDSDDEIRRQDAASEILDRILGRPTQRQEHSGPDGGPIESKDVTLGRTERDRALAELAGHIASGLHSVSSESDDPMGAPEHPAVDGAPQSSG